MTENAEPVKRPMDEQFYEVLELHDDLLVGIEVPGLTSQLWTSADLLQRAARQMGKRAQADWRSELTRRINNFYSKRADGLPAMVMPEIVEHRLQRILALCRA